MHWYDFLLFGLAVLAAAGYGYIEGHRSGFLKGVRAATQAGRGLGMSAKHPTPWTIEDGDNGKRGKARAEWAYILDARGVYVVDGMDSATAREIAEAVNGRAALRDMVRRLADNLRRYHINGERDTALLKETREVLGEGAL